MEVVDKEAPVPAGETLENLLVPESAGASVEVKQPRPGSPYTTSVLIKHDETNTGPQLCTPAAELSSCLNFDPELTVLEDGQRDKEDQSHEEHIADLSPGNKLNGKTFEDDGMKENAGRNTFDTIETETRFSNKSQHCGKPLGKSRLPQGKNRKLGGRTVSLCDVETWRERCGRHSAGATHEKGEILVLETTGFNLNQRSNTQGDTGKSGSLYSTGSKSVHICCGVANTDQEEDSDLDHCSIDADDSSVDGSRCSDDVLQDVDVDDGGKSLLGSADTDTDSIPDASGHRSTPKPFKPRCRANEELVSLSEKVGQVPPLLVYYTQIRREFNWRRFCFNHFENIDFSVFEIGSRGGYLLFRCACLLAVTSAQVCTYQLHGVSGLGLNPGPDLEPCLHFWLCWLLLLQLLVEVPVLSVQYWLYPTCYLARVHRTPLYWKLVWFLKNLTVANICSLCFMYALVFSGGDSAPLSLGANVHLILTIVCLTDTVFGATPIRLAHGLQPVLLTLAFVVYVNLWRPCSSWPYNLDVSEGSERRVRRYASHARSEEASLRVRPCYLEPVMWHVSRSCCVIITSLWVTLTFLSHCFLAVLCWSRRVVFRCRRERSAPVYGQSPLTHFYPEHGAEVSPNMLLMAENDGFEGKRFTTGHEYSPPYSSAGTLGTSLYQRRGRGRVGVLDDALGL